VEEQAETICIICKDDYGEDACLINRVCPDCFDSNDLEELIEKALD
jgi:hypothetical protein